MLQDQGFREPAFPFAATFEQVESGIIQPGGLTVRDFFTAVALHALLMKWMPDYAAGEEVALTVLETVSESSLNAANFIMQSRTE